MVCIPLLTLTTLIMMLFIDKQFYMQDTMYSVNIGTIFIFSLLSLYVYIDMIAGMVAMVVYGSLALWANSLFYISMVDSRSLLWQYTLTVNIISWIAQFIGHGVFEGRQPALVDNLLYTLCAPYFVILEVSHSLHSRSSLNSDINHINSSKPNS